MNAKALDRPGCSALAWLFCLLLALIAPAALRADSYTVPGTNLTLIYFVSGTPSTATISDCNRYATGALVIPDTLGGASVTSIGDYAFSYCSSLTSVTLPASLTSIGDYAFSYCSSLTSATLPDSVTSIGEGAFAICTSLSSVNIHASVTSIGDSAFSGCTSLTSVTLPDSVTSIGNYAFNDCTSLTNVTLPVGLTSIGDWAFYRCTSLTNVTLPASLTSIGNSVFSGCTSLTSASIPTSLTSIGEGAFYQCSSLTSVTIPVSLTSIGEGAFVGCTSLSSIDVDAANPNYASIDGVLFNKTLSTLLQAPGGLSGAYSVPASVTSIGNWAFYQCTSLTSVTLPASLTSIGYGAFYECSSLTSGTLPTSVTSIGDSAFSGCTSLTSVSIPASDISIGYDAFSHCTSLSSVTFAGHAPASLGVAVFDKVSPDFTIYYPFWATGFSTPTWLGYPTQPYDDGRTAQAITFAQPADPNYGDAPFSLSASASSSLPVTFSVVSGPATLSGSLVTLTGWGTVTIRATQAGDGTWAPAPYVERSFEVSLLFGYTINSGEITITSYPQNAAGPVIIPGYIDGLPVTSVGDYAFAGCASLTSVTLPDSVTSIGDSAFSACTSLTGVTLPDSVTSVGDYAFSACTSLTSLSISASITSIGIGAFADCTSLTNVTLPASLTSIGIGAFSSCSSLNSVNIPDSVTSIGDSAFSYCYSLTSVTLPASLTSIGSGAFSSCSSLNGVNIPDSVTSIGNGAFSYCNGLTDITLPASVISIGGWVFSYCSNLSGIDVDSANPNYASINGVLFNKTLSTLLQAPGTLSGAYSIPASVTSIVNYAFSGCSSLTSVIFPASVTSIGEAAFSDCSSLSSAIFAGHAPTSLRYSIFSWVSPDFTIYYPVWATGFSTPIWQGHPAQPHAGGLTPQAITFAQPTDHSYGDAPFSLSASASSGLPVTFSVVSGPATLSGSLVTLTGWGMVTIRATQAGDSTWAPAPSVERSFVVNISFADIADALDQPGASGGSSGTATWEVDTTVTHDGLAAARSGTIGDYQSSELTLTVADAASLSFWWKVSSESGYDHLRFSIDGVEQSAISGEVEWQQETYSLTPGIHTLQWSYTKDSSVSRGADAGWVDQVVLVPAAGGFAAWATGAGLVGPDAALDADPDADGLPNLLEYALGTSPTQATDAAQRPAVTLDLVSGEPALVLTHRRRKVGAPTYTYKTATDLATPPASWSPVALTPLVVHPDADADGQVEIVSVSVPLNGAPRLFLTLSVSE